MPDPIVTLLCEACGARLAWQADPETPTEVRLVCPACGEYRQA